MVLLCETWLNECTVSNELTLNGVYKLFRCDRPSRGGGVCILVHNRFSCVDVVNSVQCETIAIDLILDHYTVRLICSYVTNSDSAAVRKARIVDECDLISTLCLCPHPVVLVGDFNLPDIDWNDLRISEETSKESVFVNTCLSNGLYQLVSEATRKPSGSLIDLLLTTEPGIIDHVCVIDPPVRSDHQAITFSLLGSVADSSSSQSFDFRRADFEAISANLCLVSWDVFFQSCSSAEEMYAQLVEFLHYLISLFVPIRRNSSNVLHGGLKLHVKKLEERLKRSFSSSLHKRLERASRRLRMLEESSLDFKDSRSFFRYANRRLRGRERIGAIVVGDTTLMTADEKTKIFGEKFASVYVSPSNCPPSCDPVDSSCVPMSISPESVYLKLRHLPNKCSYTPDGLPPLFFKRLCNELALPLSLVYRRSYDDACVPSMFKMSFVTPVFKKGKRCDVDNYRPIAQGSIACIVFEKLLVDHVVCSLSSMGLMDPHQHGFTRGRSTATQLVEMTYDWSVFINNKVDFHCVYFDFSKAFDRVNHQLLVHKLRSLRLDEKSVNWVQSYLCDRVFSVRVDETCGPVLPCPSGVPQGSVLGPILFSMFVLDLPKVLPQNVSYKLYADDLKIYTPDMDDGVGRLKIAIDAISTWCKANDMLISVGKCSVMSSMSVLSSFSLDQHLIPVSSSYRDLGIPMNPKLDFSEHLSNTLLSVNRVSNTIFRCFIVKRPEFYLRLYNALIVPKLLYCCQVWRPYLKRDLSALDSVQSRFIRRVAFRCGIERESLTLPSLKSLFDKADLNMYNTLKSLPSFVNMFDVKMNNLRSATNVRAHHIAKSDKINNMFVWRVARNLHTK